MNNHPNKGIDYHLKALGITRDRADWEFLSRDDRVFEHWFIDARPDFALYNARRGIVLVIEYKSRAIGDGEPRERECWQVMFSAMAVAGWLEDTRGITPARTLAVLMYGDGVHHEVPYSDYGAEGLAAIIVEHLEGEEAMSASDLARDVSGENPEKPTIARIVVPQHVVDLEPVWDKVSKAEREKEKWRRADEWVHRELRRRREQEALRDPRRAGIEAHAALVGIGPRMEAD